MKRFVLSVVLAAECLVAAAPAAPPPVKPGRPRCAVERVVIISVDGLRPDCLLLASASVMRRLIMEGAYTLWARTTANATTLPSHASMLTGVAPERHGIDGTRDLSLLQPAFPAAPTVMELAAAADYTTAMVAGKASFTIFNRPGTITFVSRPEAKTAADAGVAALSHGRDDARSRHIPWVIDGPGVKRGYDLSRVPNLQVNTEDSAATACWLLGLAPTEKLDGRAVTAAFAAAD